MKFIKVIGKIDRDMQTFYLNPKYITNISEYEYLGQAYINVWVYMAHGGTGNGDKIAITGEEMVNFMKHVELL